MSIVNGQVGEASDFIGNPAPYLSIASGDGTTYSLTTVANQKVLVHVKGYLSGTSSSTTIKVNYDGVEKDRVIVRPSSSSHNDAFYLTYEEIPGAATKDITITNDFGTLNNVRVTVTKLLVG